MTFHFTLSIKLSMSLKKWVSLLPRDQLLKSGLMLDNWTHTSALRLSLLLCLVLVRMYFENAASEQYVETKGSSGCTACCALSGYSILSKDQNSNTAASLKVSFRFLSAAMSISCLSSVSGRSKSSTEAQNGFRRQLDSSSGDGKCSLIEVRRCLRYFIIF